MQSAEGGWSIFLVLVLGGDRTCAVLGDLIVPASVDAALADDAVLKVVPYMALVLQECHGLVFGQENIISTRLWNLLRCFDRMRIWICIFSKILNSTYRNTTIVSRGDLPIISSVNHTTNDARKLFKL